MKQTVYNVLHELFSISEKEFEPLKKILKTKVYKKGDLILKRGEIDNKNSFVVSGIVHQYVMIKDNMYTIDIKLSGMFFNSLKSYLEGSKSLEIHEAITDVEIVTFEKHSFEKLFNEHKFCFIYMKSIESKFLERENRAFILQHLSAFERFRLFVELNSNAQRFLLEVPQKILATYLAMTPQTYSKVKKRYFKTF